MIKFINNAYKKYRHERQRAVIHDTILFDYNYYKRKHPNVIKSSLDALDHYLLYGEKMGWQPNPYFYPAWYLSKYEKLIRRETSPLVHYISVGEKLGFKPNQMFDPKWYLEKNVDVKNAGLNPLEHFLRFGQSEQRSTIKDTASNLSKFGLIIDDTLDSNPDIYNDGFDISVKNRLKTVVVIHAYYLKLIPEILFYLRNIPFTYDLFFTVSKESYDPLEDLLKKHKINNYNISIYPNQGYDIAPFLALLTSLVDQNYELVCKIHTKKGPSHMEIFNHWFDALLKPILGSKNTVANIFKAFNENNKLGVVGAADFYKSAQALMYGNEKPVEEILSVLDKSLDHDAEWGFFAGTIFWARLDIFKPLLSNAVFSKLIHQNMGLKMKSGDPASIFHALERVLGLLPEITDMQTGVSHYIPEEGDDYLIQILPTSFKSPSREAIHSTLAEVVSRSCE